MALCAQTLRASAAQRAGGGARRAASAWRCWGQRRRGETRGGAATQAGGVLYSIHKKHGACPLSCTRARRTPPAVSATRAHATVAAVARCSCCGRAHCCRRSTLPWRAASRCAPGARAVTRPAAARRAFVAAAAAAGAPPCRCSQLPPRCYRHRGRRPATARRTVAAAPPRLRAPRCRH